MIKIRTKKPVHYLQYDPKWGNIMFSNHNDRKQNIASSGCGATSMSMIASTFIDSRIDPPTLAEFIVQNGYRTYNNGVDWSFFKFAAEYYKLNFKQTFSTDDVIQALKMNALVVASMGKGYFTNFGHYIMLWGLDENNKQILVNDPNSTTRTHASYNIFRSQASCYFIFYDPNIIKEVMNLFTDLSKNHWAAKDVEFLVSKGIVKGKDDGSFGVGEPIKREEVAVLLARILRLLGIQ